MANDRVREPVYEVKIIESGTGRRIHFETIYGRLDAVFGDPDSLMRRKIAEEDRRKWFLRTPASEAGRGRRR